MHANATRVTYALESTLESVNTAEQAALEMAAKSGFDPDECGRIGIAVREATINAICTATSTIPPSASPSVLRAPPKA